MIKKTPEFWYKPLGWQALILLPLALVFRLCQKFYFFFQKWRVKEGNPPLPIICVGNFVVGGAGKTPVARALRKLLEPYNVHFLTRGYKGTEQGPIKVQNTHTAPEVGDEALLLSQDASTWVAHQRTQAIPLVLQEGAKILIMDDGLQNLTVQKTLRFVVIDQYMGFGNGCLLPAGPLRELPQAGFKNVDACIIIAYEDHINLEKFQPLPQTVPMFIAKPVIDLPNITIKKPVIAFAGIGYPKKFFSGLKIAGYSVVACIAFPDHYFYTAQDISDLHHQAQMQKAVLLTTEKDYVRLPLALRKDILVVKMHLQWQDPKALLHFIHQFI